MKLKQLAAIIIGVSISSTTLITYFILNAWILDYIVGQENKMLLQTYAHITELMSREKESLIGTANDWSNWDDTYQFISDKNEEFIENNLTDDALESLQLDFMVFINKDMQILHIKTVGMNIAAVSELQKDVSEQMGKYGEQNTEQSLSGMLIIAGTPYFVSQSPINTSDRLSLPNGILIIGRPIGKDYIEYIEKVLGVEFSIKEAQSGATNGAQAGNSEQSIQKSKDFAAVTSVLLDISGHSSVKLRAEIPRDIYRSGMRAIAFFITFFILR